MKILTSWFVQQNPHESNEIVLFLKKSNHLKSQFIHFYIEELAESLI